MKIMKQNKARSSLSTTIEPTCAEPSELKGKEWGVLSDLKCEELVETTTKPINDFSDENER